MKDIIRRFVRIIAIPWKIPYPFAGTTHQNQRAVSATTPEAQAILAADY
jgi:hypothetical protein